MKDGQKGFSVVEVILIIVVIGLVGAVGWLVYDRQSGKGGEQPVTQSTEQVKEDKTPTAQDEASVEEEFLVVREWSVKIPLNDRISDLTYEVSNRGLNLRDKNQAVIKFYTARLKKAGGICSENTFPVSVNRGIATDVPIRGDGPGPEDTAANSYGYLYENNLIKPGGSIGDFIIKVGDYYYTDALYPGGSCSNYDDPTAEKAREDEPRDAIIEAIKAMQST